MPGGVLLLSFPLYLRALPETLPDQVHLHSRLPSISLAAGTEAYPRDQCESVDS
jgi:hypothetical protein